MCHCNKVTHLTAESATMHLDTLEQLMGVRPNVYPCPEGMGFHVGYSRSMAQKIKKKQRRIRKQNKGIKRHGRH